jgi:16S rRNA (guanine527-N7)-methyltransferase
MITTETEARSWFSDVLGIDALAIGRLDTLAALLVAENARQNLISRSSADSLWVRHFADSAQLLTVPRETSPAGSWLDLGTGAGFPGLVVAICRPDIEVVMVDSRRLRADWLRRAAEALQLSNAKTVLSRVEQLPPRTYGTVSARAFAPLETLIEVSARFSTSDTHWLLPKGAKAAQELELLSGRWNHMFHVEQSITDPTAGIVTGRLLGSMSGKTDHTAPKGRPQ